MPHYAKPKWKVKVKSGMGLQFKKIPVGRSIFAVKAVNLGRKYAA